MGFTAKRKITAFVFFLVFLVSLAVSAYFFRSYKNKSRWIFYFNSYDCEENCFEVRYSPKRDIDEAVKFFVNDLVLGPMTNRFKRLFALGTKVDFCFLSGNDLYIGLSKDALFVNFETFDLRGNVDLLRMNIEENFSSMASITTVNVYIDGKTAFCDDQF